jgi:hypothetical protein
LGASGVLTITITVGSGIMVDDGNSFAEHDINDTVSISGIIIGGVFIILAL